MKYYSNNISKKNLLFRENLCILARRNEKYSLLFIYFKNPFFQPCYPTLLFRYNEIENNSRSRTVRRNIWTGIDVYCDICETKVHIYTAIFLLPRFSSPDRIISRLEIIREYRTMFFKRIETVDLSWKKLFPRINRERFIRGIRRFRRNSWFSLRPSPNVAPIFRDKLYLVSKNSFTLCFRYTWRL